MVDQHELGMLFEKRSKLHYKLYEIKLDSVIKVDIINEWT